eukprot:409808-Pleurochrysis_carterae.AAC.1
MQGVVDRLQRLQGHGVEVAALSGERARQDAAEEGAQGGGGDRKVLKTTMIRQLFETRKPAR